MNFLKKYLTAILILALSITAPSEALSGDDSPRGYDWIGMDRTSKLAFVMVTVRSLRQSKVQLSLPHMEYAELMDQYLNMNPDFARGELTNVFANMVYAVDPGSRPGLNKLNVASRNRISAQYSSDRDLDSYYEELGIPRKTD